MKPSVCASFVVFLFVGFMNGRTFLAVTPTDPLVKWMLLAVIPSSGLYYYYLNVSTEQWPLKLHVNEHRMLSWLITVFQYVGFSLLWTLLLHGYSYYAGVLLVLNLSYLWWDWLHRNKVRQEDSGNFNFMLIVDMIGCALSFALLCLTFDLPPPNIYNQTLAHRMMWIGIVAGLIVAVSGAGLCLCMVRFKYNPLKFVWIDGSPINCSRSPYTADLPRSPNP